MSVETLYSAKDNEYFGHVRSDLLHLIPPGTRKLLDVGCGRGDTAKALKDRYGIPEVVGIEYHVPSAEAARTKLDTVITGDIEQVCLDFPEGYFDCILCADVLEHTKDPWETLRRLFRYLHEDAVMVVSLPNVRHLVPLLKIILDRLEYEESGILDKTHLKFFTLHTMKKMMADCGYVITRIEANRSHSWKFHLLNACSFGILRPLSIFQYKFVLKKGILP